MGRFKHALVIMVAGLCIGATAVAFSAPTTGLAGWGYFCSHGDVMPADLDAALTTVKNDNLESRIREAMADHKPVGRIDELIKKIKNDRVEENVYTTFHKYTC